MRYNLPMDKNTSPTTIDAYIAAFPVDTQAKLQAIRAAIHEVAPAAAEAIKYGIPTFVLNGTNLVHFGGYKDHIGFYPTPTGTEAFQKEIAGYKFAKGTIRFPLDEPLPLDLIRRITAFRAQEIEAAKVAKATEKAAKKKPKTN